MPMSFSRRRFIQASTIASAFGLIARPTAIQPFNRPGDPRLRLSLAAYSFRQYFKDASHPREDAAPAEKQIDLFQFLDYCAAQNCSAAEMTSYYFPPDPANEFLLRIKRHAFLRGLDLSGTSVGNTFTLPNGPKRDKQIAYVKDWIEKAAIMGIPHIRVFAGNTEGQSFEQAKRNCIAALEECCDFASDFGVFLGIENHGGIVAESDALLDIIQTVNSPWLGINLDTANFHTSDPYKDMERCAPYAVNVQLKTEIRAKGREKEPADLKRIVEILRRAKYQGCLVLEYEAGEDPYAAVPRVLKELQALI